MTKTYCDCCQEVIPIGAVRLTVQGEPHVRDGKELPELTDLCRSCLPLVTDLKTEMTLDEIRRCRIAQNHVN